MFVKWWKHIYQLLNLHGVNDVRQTEIQTGQPLLPEPSAFEFEMSIEKLKRSKSPGTDQISAELIKAEGRTIRSEIQKLVNSLWNKEDLPQQWKETIIVPIYKNVDKTYFSNYRGLSL